MRDANCVLREGAGLSRITQFASRIGSPSLVPASEVVQRGLDGGVVVEGHGRVREGGGEEAAPAAGRVVAEVEGAGALGGVGLDDGDGRETGSEEGAADRFAARTAAQEEAEI